MGQLQQGEPQVCHNIRLACQVSGTTVDFRYPDKHTQTHGLSIVGDSINAVAATIGSLLELGEHNFVTGLLLDEVLVTPAEDGSAQVRFTFPNVMLYGVDDESDAFEDSGEVEY